MYQLLTESIELFSKTGISYYTMSHKSYESLFVANLLSVT